MLPRPRDEARVHTALRRAPVVLLIGARQVGKTTLARSIVEPRSLNYFDLERPDDLSRLDSPMTALDGLRGVVVIDEVQHRPELFPVLRVLADRPNRPATFLILGSAAPEALRQASESLTGRIEEVTLGGFGGSDPDIQPDLVWLRGGFPRSLLAESAEDSMQWRRQYIRNLTTRDLPGFGTGLPAATIERYLQHVAHVHGNLWNAAAVARSLGISESTSRRYLDILDDALIVRILQPWHENIGKRITRSPKVYFRDTGIVHEILGIGDTSALMRSSIHGASWESFVIDECLRRAPEFRPYHWRTSNGAELDLFLTDGRLRIGVEVKRTDAPRLTSSMRSALKDLRLDALWVIYPGSRRFALETNVIAMPFDELLAAPTLAVLHGRTRQQSVRDIIGDREHALSTALATMTAMNIPALTEFSESETASFKFDQEWSRRGHSSNDRTPIRILLVSKNAELRERAAQAIVNLLFGLERINNPWINKVAGTELISPYANHTVVAVRRAVEASSGETLFVDDINGIYVDTSDMPDLPAAIPHLTASGDVEMARRLPRIDGDQGDSCASAIRAFAKREPSELQFIIGGDKPAISRFHKVASYGGIYFEHLDLDS
ncbi:ATP-binding protein [Mycobacterium sp. CBMA271]|uniref:ATP-binding protein n=1 Tax=unclassified Mycobacteroides TaxID=2618759 RepID=UPI0012DDE18F|nr:MULTISPECIES: ATP-binding protein [unclassified Mycobacteroides]MUM20051.1 hypothetical protein [Mycobacteroides sp. CBMA 326]MUM24001.1 ATP-binding protein [Mycobacteroides sp. CBMA 271]